MTRRHWFHLTPDDHGPLWVAGRRTPRNPDPKEPPVPRLCVCPSVPACFAAQLFPENRSVNVYRTLTPHRGVKPRGVWDQVVSGERWLVPPVRMVCVDVIDPAKVNDCTAASRLYLQHRQQGMTVRLRVAQYARAVEVLGHDWPDPREERVVRRWKQYFGIGDPDDYILDAAIRKAK